MSTEVRPAHSPLGASGAERWMNCAGSIELLKLLKLPESDEKDYQINGTAAHWALEQCLKGDMDAWEVVGQVTENGTEVTHEMASAVQVFIDYTRPTLAIASKVYIEHGIDAPDFHPLFYGTVDCGAVWAEADEPFSDGFRWVLDVNDFKYGEGIMVDVEWNPQIMYYAYGLLRRHPEVEHVRLRIIQPRGFHHDGPVREWEVSAETIRTWAIETLKPAMDAAELDHDFHAGDWCRFCPAKLVCPLMRGLFGAAMNADLAQISDLSNEALGRDYQFLPAIKKLVATMEEEAFRRLNLGQDVPGAKLVQKKANRVLKDGAFDAFVKRFGTEAIEEPSLKSPAQLELIGPAAKSMVKEWAYTPMTGLTVAVDNDKRAKVRVQTTAEAFPGAAKLLEGTNDGE